MKEKTFTPARGENSLPLPENKMQENTIKRNLKVLQASVVTSDKTDLLQKQRKHEEPWELRAFDNIDNIIEKVTPAILTATTLYFISHLVWMGVRVFLN